jgi:hypothetical protein
LVEGCKAKEVASRAGSRSRCPGSPGNSRGVVRADGQGTLPDILGTSKDGGVSNCAGQLKIRICDGPSRMLGSNESMLDGGRERMTPHIWRVRGLVSVGVGRREPNSTHSTAGSVRGAQVGGLGGDNFPKTSRPGGKVSS